MFGSDMSVQSLNYYHCIRFCYIYERDTLVSFVLVGEVRKKPCDKCKSLSIGAHTLAILMYNK